MISNSYNNNNINKVKEQHFSILSLDTFKKTFFRCILIHCILLCEFRKQKINNTVFNIGIYSNLAILYTILSYASSDGRRWMKYHRNIIRGIKISQLYVDSFLNNTHLVYMIVSPITKHWYIGMTTRTLVERMNEHIRLPSSDLKLYDTLKKVGVNFFLFIPIQVNVLVGLNNLEKMLISRFTPSLNSKLYPSKKFLEYRLVRKRCRWGKRRRITMRRLNNNMIPYNKNNENKKNWRSLPYFIISTENYS